MNRSRPRRYASAGLCASILGFGGLLAVPAQATPMPVDPNGYVPATMTVGQAPKGIGIDDNIGIVVNSGSNTATAFSVCLPKVCQPTTYQTMSVGSQPTSAAVSSIIGAARAYVTNSGSGTVSVIGFGEDFQPPMVNAGTIAVGGQPTGIALSPNGRRAYVSDNQLNVLDVIDTQALAVVAKLPMPEGPWGVATSQDGELVYVVSNRANAVTVVNASTLQAVATIPVGTLPANIAIDPAGGTGYVTNNGSNSVSVVNLSANQVVATIAVGTQPWGIEATDHAVFVANYASGNVSVIDPDLRKVIATVQTGANPFDVAATYAKDLLVTNAGANQVSVIDLQAPWPEVDWSSSPTRRTVTGVVPTVAAVTRSIVATKGGTTRRGSCQLKGDGTQTACTIALSRGTWQVSVQSKLPWEPAAGGMQRKKFTFR